MVNGHGHGICVLNKKTLHQVNIGPGHGLGVLGKKTLHQVNYGYAQWSWFWCPKHKQTADLFWCFKYNFKTLLNSC